MSHPFPPETTPSPDMDQLEQLETAETVDARLTVVVDEVRDAVRTQAVPARGAVMQSMTIPAGVATGLFGKDLRRSRAVVWVASAETPLLMYVGTSREEVQQGTSAILETGGRELVMLHGEAIYARAATEIVTVSYMLEQWAD